MMDTDWYCRKCDMLIAVRAGQEPTALCDDCAHEEADLQLVELSRLRAENARLRLQIADAASELSRVSGPIAHRIRVYERDHAERVEKLLTENDRLRADAERYRFLRNNPQQMGWDSDYRPDEVDRAVDAARAAVEGK